MSEYGFPVCRIFRCKDRTVDSVLIEENIGQRKPVFKQICTYLVFFKFIHIPGNVYLFKVNNRNTTNKCEKCSKLTIKYQNNVIDVVLVFLLLTLNNFQKA